MLVVGSGLMVEIDGDKRTTILREGSTMKFESKGDDALYAQQFKQSVSQKRVVCTHHARGS